MAYSYYMKMIAGYLTLNHLYNSHIMVVCIHVMVEVFYDAIYVFCNIEVHPYHIDYIDDVYVLSVYVLNVYASFYVIYIVGLHNIVNFDNAIFLVHDDHQIDEVSSSELDNWMEFLVDMDNWMEFLVVVDRYVVAYNYVVVDSFVMVIDNGGDRFVDSSYEGIVDNIDMDSWVVDIENN